MEQNPVGSSESNNTNQPPTGNEWTNNDNFNQNLVKTFNETTINDDSGAERHDGHSDFTNNGNGQYNWENQYESKDDQGYKDNSGYRGGRGGYNKSNHSNNSFDNSWGDNSSNNFQSNSGQTRGRGRGRGFIKKFNEENNSFGNEYNSSFNNQSGITAPGHRGQGRGSHRGRGGRFRQNSGGFNENNGDGSMIKENNKPSVPYIPPDIEDGESIAGIEAGLNFDKYDKIDVKVSGIDPPNSVTSFYSSGLREVLLENLTSNNFSTSTPIQNYSIPIIIAGRDLMASAQTGSGKTAAFVLPILHNLLKNPTPLIYDENHCEPHVVIMAPTRELVVQICECVWKFSKGTHIKNGLLYGGTSVGHQRSKILQGGVHILTATPGRLNDFVDKGIVAFSSIKFFVLDEADRMLDMGFKSEIERVLKHPTMTPIDMRQTLMFSATFASEIQHMAKSYLKPDYIFVAVGEIGGACKDVVQTVLQVGKFKKKETLLNFLKELDDCQGTIVFVEHKRTADYTAAYLSELDFPTTSIHGDREQPERERALNDLKSQKMKVLVATAVAARGLDIKGVNHVVNYDLPKTIDEYVHRIGRTGRLGNAGRAISFFDPEVDGRLASELIRILSQAEQEVPAWLNDAATHMYAAPDIDDFNDIRSNVEVPSEMVATEEEW